MLFLGKRPIETISNPVHSGSARRLLKPPHRIIAERYGRFGWLEKIMVGCIILEIDKKTAIASLENKNNRFRNLDHTSNFFVKAENRKSIKNKKKTVPDKGNVIKLA